MTTKIIMTGRQLNDLFTEVGMPTDYEKHKLYLLTIEGVISLDTL